MNTFTVTRFMRDVDMRAIHEFRFKHAKSLRGNQVILAINKRATIIRLVTANAGVCHWYSDDGKQFDVDRIQQAVAAIGLTLRLTGTQMGQVRRSQQAATRRLHLAA